MVLEKNALNIFSVIYPLVNEFSKHKINLYSLNKFNNSSEL